MRHFLSLPLAAVAVLALTPVAPIHAQTGYGVMAGGSLANFTGDFFESKATTTFLFGGFANFGHGDITIQPGILWNRKGAKDSDAGSDIKVAIDFIQIPVIARIGMPAGNSGRFYLGVGPALGIKTGCKLKGSNGGVSASVNCDQIEDGMDAKSTELSAIGEVGMEFGKFSIGLRGDLGLTNAFGVTTGGVSIEPDGKTSTLSLIGAIRF